MPISISIGDAIATGALTLSAYATWKTFKFNERQNTLIESQERLNKLLLEKETGEVQSFKKADLGATFIKLGSTKYRLKVWNKGKSAARNVSLEFPEGYGCLIQSDIDSKFPLEILETNQSVELIAAVSMDTKNKHPIRLVWSDGFSENNEKLAYPTI
jgi:DNA polymerase III sliding clamp (beta) subunit (PCNA family)